MSTGIAIIQRYCNGTTQIEEVVLPPVITVTGDEDHFALAYAAARNIVSGMRIADEMAHNRDNPPSAPPAPGATPKGEPVPPPKVYYRIKSIRLD